MGIFITRIRLPQGNPADQKSLHNVLSAEPGLSLELRGFRKSGSDLEIEYRTTGTQTIADLGRTIAGAVETIKKPSTFFIIREKKS